MPSVKFKFLLLTLLATTINVVALETDKLDENILSKDRLDLFNLNKEQVEEDSSKLKKDWINPIMYTYSKNYGEFYDTEKSFISIDQPIFKTGGIYSAIKYANSLKQYSHLDIELRKKALIKDTINLLFNIHKIELQIKKQELLVNNGTIDIERKKDQVLNGFLDTALLDNAILDTNTNKNMLADLEYQRDELINSFDNYASDNYKTFDLPKLKLINKDIFIENNINILSFIVNSVLRIVFVFLIVADSVDFFVSWLMPFLLKTLF